MFGSSPVDCVSLSLCVSLYRDRRRLATRKVRDEREKERQAERDESEKEIGYDLEEIQERSVIANRAEQSTSKKNCILWTRRDSEK